MLIRILAINLCFIDAVG